MRQKRRERQPFENDFFSLSPSLRMGRTICDHYFHKLHFGVSVFLHYAIWQFFMENHFLLCDKLHTFIALLPFWPKHAIIFDRFLVETWNFLDYVFDVASSKSNLEVLWRPFKPPLPRSNAIYVPLWIHLPPKYLSRKRAGPRKRRNLRKSGTRRLICVVLVRLFWQ